MAKEMEGLQCWDSDDGYVGRCVGKAWKPRKSFFLKLAADSILEVNNLRDENGLSHTRKATIRIDLKVNVNPFEGGAQLFEFLQKIINKYRNHFEGEEDDPLE